MVCLSWLLVLKLQLLVLFLCFVFLTMRWHEDLLYCSCLFGTPNISCVQMPISFSRFGKFFPIILLTKLSMSFDFTSALFIPWILSSLDCMFDFLEALVTF